MTIETTTLEHTTNQMQALLGDIVPDFELKLKAELVHEINSLKREKHALILGHNYMEPALFHTIPDVVGDSLQLARAAAQAQHPIIVFCGVRFMAETAKILSPEKTVLIPAKRAGCSLASSITAEDVRTLKRKFPGVPVVTYINTYADVKAETDICCTSSNAKKIIESLPNETIIFLPDEYLARNVAAETGKKIIFPQSMPSTHIPDIIGWHGKCEVHDRFTPADVHRAREHYDDIAILAHPECPPEVVEQADYCGSTSAMISFVEKTPAQRFLLLTECSMADNIAAANPHKEMVGMCSVRCPHMNEITLEDTLKCLREMHYEVEVEESIRVRALSALERMLEY